MHSFENYSEKSFMKNEINITNRQQELNRLCREPSDRLKETAILSSPSAGTSAWAVTVQDNCAFNVYDVVNVVIEEPGSEPIPQGITVQAINLAEPFDQQGTLPIGSYVIIFRLGTRYVFYAKP
jgi:hypothetical protein